MPRAARAMACIIFSFLLHIGVFCFLAMQFAPPLPMSITTTSKYQRIPKSDIQKSVIIVSDMTSHFGRDAAFKLAEMGFYVLGGVHTESERRAYSGYNTVKGINGIPLFNEWQHV